MNYLLSILLFITGAAAAMVFFKIKKKKTPNVDSFAPLAPIKIPEEKTIQDNETVKLQQQLNNLFLVNELSQRITSSLSIEESFSHLYNTINSMMDASVVELVVYGDDGKRLFFSNKKYPVSTVELTHYNHMGEWSLKNDKEIFLEDAINDYGRYVFKPLTMPDGKEAQSLMIFPVHYFENITGTLCIMSFSKKAFELFHKEMVRLLLPFVGVAINNASTHQQIIALKQRAERSEKFMQQFLANMSHEIRTPINAVTGMTRLLLEKGPQPQQLKYLESIRNASDSLLVIINDILDLSKIEAGKIEIEKIDFSVYDVITNVKEIMQFKAEEKGLLLSAKIEENIPPVLIGDPTRLTQILINLIGNAIKFTEKGNVSLNVIANEERPDSYREKQSADYGEIASFLAMTFEVNDTGIGMSKEQQSKLFQDYVQASSDTARKYGGTGLGLSISKQLVQLQGGTIEVRSRQGEGSTFSFQLSYPVSKNKTVARKEKSVSKAMLQQLKGLKVLLADDNEYNRIIAKETLELKIENVTVEEATDGAMAVELIKNNDYDVVLMDLVMPQLDGLEATQIVRNKFPFPKNKIHIIALTASVVKSEIDKCFAAGMNGFIPKPFKAHDLLGAIYNALHGEDAQTYIELAAEKDKKITSSGKLVDLEYLRDFTEGDEVRFKRYIDLFLTKTPAGISSLQTALEAKDYESMRITAHSLKPQFQVTGVLEGLEIAEMIEQNCKAKLNLEQLPELIEQLQVIADRSIEELRNFSINH